MRKKAQEYGFQMHTEVYKISPAGKKHPAPRRMKPATHSHNKTHKLEYTAEDLKSKR